MIAIKQMSDVTNPKMLTRKRALSGFNIAYINQLRIDKNAIKKPISETSLAL